jgi:hypothetical protein
MGQDSRKPTLQSATQAAENDQNRSMSLQKSGKLSAYMVAVIRPA